jgi:iron complex outermembrane recepter protein
MKLIRPAPRRLTPGVFAGCAFLMGAPALSSAADTSDAAAASTAAAPAADGATVAANGSDMTEVIVKGSLRTQRLQDAATAVSVVAPADLTDFGFKQPSDLQFLSPSVTISAQGANSIYIRGEGTNSQIAGEQSVGLVIDGVVQGFDDDIGGDTSDLNQVEIYRGPQGTQFGKNSSAGAVVFTTNNPKLNTYSSDVHATWGSYNDSSDYIDVNAPIGDKLAARFVLGFQNRDGDIPTPFLSGDNKDGFRQQGSARLKVLAQPSDDWSILFTGDARWTWEAPNLPQAWAHCDPPMATTPYINSYGTYNIPACNGGDTVPGFVASPTNSEVVEDHDAHRKTVTGGGSVQVTGALGNFTLTSISAYRFMQRYWDTLGNNGPIPQYILQNDYDGFQLSQELRIASPDKQPLTYVGGIFLYDRSTTVTGLRSGSFWGQAYYEYPDTPYGENVLISPNGGLTRGHNIDESGAGFLDGSFHFTDQLQLNAGVRVTHDEVTSSTYTYKVAGVYPVTVGGSLFPDERLVLNKTGTTYHVGPQYFITPDLQVYATYAYGYKGPLIDNTVKPINAILPETVKMFEAGLKSSWFNHKLTANLTGFYEDFDDLQVTIFNINVVPNVFQLGNAAGAKSKGVELETALQPIDSLKFSADWTYDDAFYTNFATQCWNALEPIKQAASGINGCYIHPGQTGLSTNAAGTPMVNTSKNVFTLSSTFTHPVYKDWSADATASYIWRSNWLTQPMDPNVINPSYGVLNLNAGISSPDGKYRLGVFARNLLNTFFISGSQPNNGGWTHILSPEAVRTVGVSIDAHF